MFNEFGLTRKQNGLIKGPQGPFIMSDIDN